MNTAWGTMTQMIDRATSDQLTLDQLYAKLMAPPIGLKEGPIPVLLTALLLHRLDDVAIYQEGTYQPSLTADLLERLVKSPDRFAVKHFKLTGPSPVSRSRHSSNRERHRTRSGPRPGRGVTNRNPALLGVTGPLLAMFAIARLYIADQRVSERPKRSETRS